LKLESLNSDIEGASPNDNLITTPFLFREQGETQSQTGKDAKVCQTLKDRTVYKTYFRAMGNLNALIFLIAGIAFAVALKFPGESCFRGVSVPS
jgi:hypothetical protein